MAQWPATPSLPNQQGVNNFAGPAVARPRVLGEEDF